MNLDNVVKILKNGGVIVYPTETAYALGCDITNEKAVRRIYRLKKRSKTKSLTAIVSDLKMAKKFGRISKVEEKIIKKRMPGAFTLIVEKKKLIPDIANMDLAFRISSNKIAKHLSRALKKPIASTSANISGTGAEYNIKPIIKEFGTKVDAIIDSGNLPKKKVSTIAKVIEGKLVILRK